MALLEIFEHSLCCSPVKSKADLQEEWSAFQSLIDHNEVFSKNIVRHSLSTNARRFHEIKMVHELLLKHKTEILPICVLDGEVVCTNHYPTQDELNQYFKQ
jgi:hypothetical protein